MIEQFWYYNTTDPTAQVGYFHDSYGRETILDMAEKRDYLIIFEMAPSVYNRLTQEGEASRARIV